MLENKCVFSLCKQIWEITYRSYSYNCYYNQIVFPWMTSMDWITRYHKYTNKPINSVHFHIFNHSYIYQVFRAAHKKTAILIKLSIRNDLHYYNLREINEKPPKYPLSIVTIGKWMSCHTAHSTTSRDDNCVFSITTFSTLYICKFLYI